MSTEPSAKQPSAGGSSGPPLPGEGGESARNEGTESARKKDDRRWLNERDDYIHNRLARVQASAQAWLAALGTVLGLSGTVVIFKGPETLADTTGNAVWRIFAWLGQDAEPPREWDFREYREYVEAQADVRRRYLHRSRLCGLVAGTGAGLLFLLALVLASFHRPPAPSGPTVIAVHGGQISCGTLTRDGRGRVLVSGQRLNGVTQILLTDHC